MPLNELENSLDLAGDSFFLGGGGKSLAKLYCIMDVSFVPTRGSAGVAF